MVLIINFKGGEVYGGYYILAVLWVFERGSQVIIVMSMVMNRAAGVDMLPLKIILMVVRSEVGALHPRPVSSQSLPDVIRPCYFCFVFCGQ